jgi:hypothetical protein
MSKFTSIVGSPHFRKCRENPCESIIIVQSEINLLGAKNRYLGRAIRNQAQNAGLLFAAIYLASSCLSSDLVSFDYETAAINIRISGHRKPVVFCYEDFSTVRSVGSPGPVQFECNGRKAKKHTAHTT